MASKRKTWVGRVHLGAGRYQWVGRFEKKQERDQAVAEARAERPWEKEAPNEITCGAFADRFLARYERDHKDSSYDTARVGLGRFKADFGDRPMVSITRHETIAWAERVPPSKVPIVVTLFNVAVDEELIDRNPFRGLGHRTRGRADQAPPTVEQLEQLLDGCAALGDYAGQMRALITFGAYSGMRPGELMALEWGDIDLAANRVDVQRRLYRGRLDIPKSNKARRIALAPPARDALLSLPSRPPAGLHDARETTDQLVFRSKDGRRLSQPTLSGYWSQVKARADLDFDFYLATKHYGVHLLYKLGLSTRAIAAQMGWSEKAVENLLRVYGHIDLIALEEVDALYEKVTPLRVISDADSDARAADPAL
jgi:integrase